MKTNNNVIRAERRGEILVFCADAGSKIYLCISASKMCVNIYMIEYYISANRNH